MLTALDLGSAVASGADCRRKGRAMMHRRPLNRLTLRHDEEDEAPIGAGDWVRTGLNIHPDYQVIAVSGDKAWIRDPDQGHEIIANLCRCHRIDRRAEGAKLC